MRAPVDFVVTRHLLAHPQDIPAKLQRHCRLAYVSASTALKRLREKEIWTDAQVLAHAETITSRPKWRTLYLRLPNPKLWPRAFKGAHAMSGEEAAVIDGYDLVPERYMYYVDLGSLDSALAAAVEVGGRLSPRAESNLILRERDPWLYDDPVGVVERGQRLLDYKESRHVQLLRGLKNAP